ACRRRRRRRRAGRTRPPRGAGGVGASRIPWGAPPPRPPRHRSRTRRPAHFGARPTTGGARMLDRRLIAEVVGRALAEDAPWGDLTGAHVIPAEAIAQAHLVARADGVLAGAEVVTETFRQADDAIEVILTAHDGDRIEAGQRLATVHGPARGVLAGERVALNFAQRMSGSATTTARYVAAVAGTGARIADTRKTAPGLRAFDKH